MATTRTTPAPPSEEIPYSPRNFWSWVAYQFFYRIGWQFKMESTMMAGLVSFLAPQPFVMGLFTAINNVGKNIAPLVAAPIVDRFRYKRAAMWLFWALVLLSWLVLTLYLWLPGARDKGAAIWIFGACYTLFFVFLGATSVAQGALLGKIIPADMRGRAMAVGMTLSGVINVAAIYWIYAIVRTGRFPEPRNYALSFTLTVTFFLLAGLAILFVREEPSAPQRRPFDVKANLRLYRRLARANPNLARLMVVNLTLATTGSMLQFYTAYWREAGTLTESALVMATVFQVAWQSISCSIFGRVADARGNRIVICWLLWAEALSPVSAWVLGGFDPFRGSWYWFLGVYTLIGARMPVYQLLVNYLLEITPQEDHAVAIGAVTTVQVLAAPAPLVLGAMAGLWGYPLIFVLGGAIGVYGCLTALGLEEVRIRKEAGAGS